MGYGIEFLIALIILLNGARTDLLDMLPTGAYWEAKKVTVSVEQLERDAGPDEQIAAIESLVADLASPEFRVRDKAKASLKAMGPSILPQLQPALNAKTPEVKAVAVEIAREFEAETKERAVRRLMAIRTLGERREKDALPLLKSLTDSKEMFVAEYAARAVTSIEGAAWAAPDRSASIRGDLQLLPRHAGVVGQTMGVATAPVTLETLFNTIGSAGNGGAAGQGGMNRDTAISQGTSTLLRILERTGNVRIDGLTFALSDDAGETTGWEIVMLRGQFDAAALLASARTLARPADGNVKYSNELGIPVVQTDVDTQVMFPSDQLAIVVMADEDKDRIARMIALAYALRAGHGTMTTDQDLAAMMKGVDTTAPLWLAGRLNAEEKKSKLLEGVDSFTVVGKREKDSMSLSLRAAGEDQEKLKGSADELNTDIQWVRQTIPQGAALAPVAAFLGTVHAQSAGTSATASADVRSELPNAILANFLPLLDLKVPDNNAANGGGQPIGVGH